MPVSGRSTWLCGDRACVDDKGRRTRLATVRGVYPQRRVRFLTVVDYYREDGVIEIECPKCKRLNRFRWTAPSEKVGA